jgi:energy-coupling factor transport system ATP-binding protein
MRLDGVRLRFTGEESFSLAIDSLELESGTICALLGRNGSGKSTLARILCGLIRPPEGTTSLWKGSGYQKADTGELNRRIGYLFQNPDHQIFLPSVFEELSLGLKNQGIGAGEAARRVEDACRRFLLPDPMALPSLMSFGARRRLQAATYSLLQRDILILDEVDTGLSYRELEILLKELFMPPTGILLITHDALLAKAVSDRNLLQSSGRVRADLRQKDFGRLESLLDEDGDDL